MDCKTPIALVFGLALLGSGGSDPTPWPSGAPPSGAHVDELVADALELAALERSEEYLEASEKGEDSEHILVFQEDIDAGMWDLDALFAFGDALFGHEFRKEDGYADQPEVVGLQRVHAGARGGLDTFSCAGCHSKGGPDGAGSATQNAFLFGDGASLTSALVRNPPMALGLGFVQALAAEMTTALQLRRDEALAQAAASGAAVSVALEAKGVAFGELVARPDGSVDSAGTEGVDADLVVKPFGWKGTFPTIRRVVEDAARVHFGVQSHVLALQYQDSPDEDLLGPGPHWWDPDADGRQRELEEGALTAAAVYLAMVEAPIIIPPSDPQLRDRWARGSALFDSVGCDACHRRSLILESATWDEMPDTTDGPPVSLNLINDGEGPKSGPIVELFSDLKRHDLGPRLADPHGDNRTEIATSVWLTRPLWCLAETGPYLHDGTAATIPEAILAHGGEAEPARERFVRSTPTEQADLHIFLLSLSRAPKVRVPL